MAELTVEDPAESFEDLRDVNDLRFLVAEGVTEDPLFTQGVGQNERGPRAKWEKEIRNKYKLAQVSSLGVFVLDRADGSDNLTDVWRCCCSSSWIKRTR